MYGDEYGVGDDYEDATTPEWDDCRYRPEKVCGVFSSQKGTIIAWKLERRSPRTQVSTPNKHHQNEHGPGSSRPDSCLYPYNEVWRENAVVRAMVGIEEFVIDIQQKDGYCTGKRLNGVVQVVNPDDYEALCLSPTLPAVPLYLPKTTIRDVRQLCAALQAYVQRYCNK